MKKSTFFTSSPHFSVVSAMTGINGKRCITDSRGMGLTVVHLIIYYMVMGVTRGDARLIQSDTGRIENAKQRTLSFMPIVFLTNE